MPITITNAKSFKLDSQKTSYVFGVNEYGYIVHYYYGARIDDADIEEMSRYESHGSVCPRPVHDMPVYFSLDINKIEYSFNGTGDFRVSALQIKDKNGCSSTDLRYLSHRTYNGKPEIPGQPATYASESEAETLEVDAIDAHTGAIVTLFYTVFNDYNAITRHVRVKNTSNAAFNIERIYSTCVDFYNENLELLHLWGNWGKERNIERRPLNHGIQTIASKRGMSSHNHNPFVALVSPSATETYGDVYGFNLVYTGNFSAEVERDSYETTRLIMGIESTDFTWLLKPGEEFYAPEVVMVYSNEGLGDMSRTYHKLYRNNLCRGEWKLKKRPILVNNWEATYFKFNEEKLYDIAKDASELGIEMLVMDDGWFGARENANAGLGDWFVNEEKLKGGLGALVERVNALGMKFGIWFEPEMVNPDSDLYRNHHDWVLHIPGRKETLSRNQCVLDITRPEVRDYLFDCIKTIMESANIEYIKWDFNRPLTEVCSAVLTTDEQKGYFHRYVLALYELLDRITKAYPQILIEGCASGGGRFDPAWLYYAPQFWTSDQTDAIERMDIQYGTSLCYPLSTIGAHVSAVPNHNTRRKAPFKTRGDVALFGTFGYELDVTQLTDEEKELVKVQCENYHKYNDIIRDGDFYRLISPFEGSCNEVAWICVKEDKSEALLLYGVKSIHPYMPHTVRLCGLDPTKKYQNSETGSVYYGSTLMGAGVNFGKKMTDYTTKLVHFTVVE